MTTARAAGRTAIAMTMTANMKTTVSMAASILAELGYSWRSRSLRAWGHCLLWAGYAGRAPGAALLPSRTWSCRRMKHVGQDRGTGSDISSRFLPVWTVGSGILLPGARLRLAIVRTVSAAIGIDPPHGGVLRASR